MSAGVAAAVVAAAAVVVAVVLTPLPPPPPVRRLTDGGQKKRSYKCVSAFLSAHTVVLIVAVRSLVWRAVVPRARRWC